MSMTREEAIAILEESKRQNEIMRDNPSTFWASHQMAEGVKNAKRRIEAFEIALSALRPVSREQVERVWYRRGWKYDNPRVDGGIMYSATNTCMYCGSETPIGNFCYRCGIAQTDMGVDVVMERLEVLYNETR